MKYTIHPPPLLYSGEIRWKTTEKKSLDQGTEKHPSCKLHNKDIEIITQGLPICQCRVSSSLHIFLSTERDLFCASQLPSGMGEKRVMNVTGTLGYLVGFNIKCCRSYTCLAKQGVIATNSWTLLQKCTVKITMLKVNQHLKIGLECRIQLKIAQVVSPSGL